MSASTNNPWQPEGVSVIPKDPSELLPLVGQERLFKSLKHFKEAILTPSAYKLAGFFTLIGGWGVGKSRVGHELCVEPCADDVSWIVNGNKERVLEAGLRENILPLFVRYIQVTKGPLEKDLEAETWIPVVVVEALSRLAGLRGAGDGKTIRNQQRLLELVRKALKPRGWDTHLPALTDALGQADPQHAARAAIDALKKLGIHHLWVVVDEIEDITDVERDGLGQNEREGIDQGLLTVIPRVIKAEEPRMEFPEVNFLLLCSLAVGDLLKQVRAIERRTGWHELTTNTFSDVQSFFRYLESNPVISEAIKDYPDGLKEAAFFAANRNFGWFNVIMNQAHLNHRDGKLEAPDLLEKFAEASAKGTRGTVFDIDALGQFRLEHDADHAEIKRAVYGLLPQEVGVEIDEEKARRFLEKVDEGNQRHIFARVLEIKPPERHLIMAHLVRCGFKSAGGNELILEGEARFDLATVMGGLEAYTIRLDESRRAKDHLLVCEDRGEFTEQLRGLTPYGEQAMQFSEYLHGLLMDEKHRVKNASGADRVFVAPAFSFLLSFSRLNKLRHSEQGYLRDGAKNSTLEESKRAAEKDAVRRTKALLHGIVNCWEGERAPVDVEELGLKVPAVKWTASQEPLDLASEHSAVVMLATGSSDTDVEQSLTRVSKDGVLPIVLIFEDEDARAEALRDRISRAAPRVAPFVAIHRVAGSIAREHFLRLGLMGEAYVADDLKTSHFHAVIGQARQHLRTTLESWLESSIHQRGLLLRPVFLGTRPVEEEIHAFARGYAALVDGKSYDDLAQSGAGVFVDEERDRDLFVKAVKKHMAPGPKYENLSREELLVGSPGEYEATLPRNLLAMLQECSSVPVSQKDLLRHFLFDVRDRKNPQIGVKPRDVISQMIGILEALGLVQDVANGRFARISKAVLTKHVEAAQAWVTHRFEDMATDIQAIHGADGEDLKNVRAKDAQHRLKQAHKKLKQLNLDFVGKPWAELNRLTEDGTPVFEDRLRAAIHAVAEVHSDVHWVYDPEAEKRFQYRIEAVRDFDRRGSGAGYPLWLRVSVLHGLYRDLDGKRKKLLDEMGTLDTEVKNRIPAIQEGPEAGQQAFPMQPISLQLGLFRQELDFDPENPAKTIAALGTTVGVNTLGYKLSSRKYEEALQRVDFIRAELHDSGKHRERYLAALSHWEGLCAEVKEIDVQAREIEEFFVDAAENRKRSFGVAALKDATQNLFLDIVEGGIREKTDERELSRVRVEQLLRGLEQDLADVAGKPAEVKRTADEVFPKVRASLEAQYQEEFKAALSAIARIRKVNSGDPLRWPDKLADTYEQTVEGFKAIVETIEKEGNAYFDGVAGTTFKDYIAFVDSELEGLAINWEEPQNARHVGALQKLRLLQLRLVL